MDHTDLYLLRETYNHKNLLLCFNGPFSQGLIEEIGIALRKHLQNDASSGAGEGASPSDAAAPVSSAAAALDVFAVYIELAQNIRRYSLSRGYGDSQDSWATVVIGRESSYRYTVLAGNIVEPEDGHAVQQKVEQLARLDKAELRAAYKKQLRQPRDPEAATGAGLGLIDIARKAHEPISCSLRPVNAGTQLFFSLRVVI